MLGSQSQLIKIKPEDITNCKRLETFVENDCKFKTLYGYKQWEPAVIMAEIFKCSCKNITLYEL